MKFYAIKNLTDMEIEMKQIAMLTAYIGFKGIAGTEKYEVMFDETDELTFEQVEGIASEQRVAVDKAFKNQYTGSLIIDNVMIDITQIRTFKLVVTKPEETRND